MSSISRFLLSASLLCMSQVAFADCDDPDALPDCFEVTPDENDTVDTSSSGGGAIYVGGGSTGGQQEGNSGNGGGSSTGSGQTSTSSGSTKSERQKCLESAAAKNATCKAKASADFAHALSTICTGLGTVSGGVTTGFTATVTIEEYNQCKDVYVAKKENALDVCIVLDQNRTNACPAN